jgi:hypothetical protein
MLVDLLPSDLLEIVFYRRDAVRFPHDALPVSVNSCHLIDLPDQDFSHEPRETASVEG